MDVGTLILLGASGGLLRGLLDAYTGFSQWHAARREHRQGAAGPDTEVPVFQDYVDPVADSLAAVVHSALGAGAAVLFGTTGQISGAYAALVVGMSAPLLLSQLGQAQSVSDTILGAAQAPGSQSPQTLPLPGQPSAADRRIEEAS
ncbi:hypothetical protein [Streptomyces maremycinicus]|uniref:hypothetical protein n=1 Tax=Streptomyces maremycinicus TaxID=1679753 RepID=UPI0007897F5E|nr:hypothetical protein [Streptomyces sp. NBRC 110468]